jgi:hypothetical protein
MRWGSRGLLPRSDRRQRNCLMPQLRAARIVATARPASEDFASRLRQLHRAIDLGFPEFHVGKDSREPARPHHSVARPNCGVVSWRLCEKLASIIYDGSHEVGEDLSRTVIEAAEKSVGGHHSEPYRLSVPRQPFLPTCCLTKNVTLAVSSNCLFPDINYQCLVF